MKISKLDVCVKDGLEHLVLFLEQFGITSKYINFDKYNFSRTIEFVVNEQTYQVVWFINESKLIIGNNIRSPFVVFKHVYFDNCTPIVGGNNNLGFSYTKNVKNNMFDREFDYQNFRIPL